MQTHSEIETQIEEAREIFRKASGKATTVVSRIKSLQRGETSTRFRAIEEAHKDFVAACREGRVSLCALSQAIDEATTNGEGAHGTNPLVNESEVGPKPCI